MQFLVTGGTIDKMKVLLPNGSFDHSSKIFEKTHLPEILEQARFVGEHAITTLFMLDSLDMNDEHREIMSDAIEASADEEIIITHGTDTMPDTARFLSRRSQVIANKTIVLTGAMEPFCMGELSDAVRNIHNAVQQVRTQPNGVYIAMEDTAFDADNVFKDVSARQFKRFR